jgi:hypothetical protein
MVCTIHYVVVTSFLVVRMRYLAVATKSRIRELSRAHKIINQLDYTIYVYEMCNFTTLIFETSEDIHFIQGQVIRL